LCFYADWLVTNDFSFLKSAPYILHIYIQKWKVTSN
jgi:hypothetical protein